MKVKIKKERNVNNRFLIMLLVFSLIACFFAFNKNSINTNIIRNIKNKAGVKSNSIVKSADIVIVDGTGPFEDNNNPGNDSNDHNNIVRANDSLIYMIQPFTELIDKNNKKYGNIVVEGKLPKQRLISWHKEENNKFAGENITYTEDSNNYYFTYKKDYNELIGGKEGGASVNFPFQVLVSGARNGTKINPTFTIYMEGNEQSKKKVITPKEVVVSSEPRYSMKLYANSENNKKITYNGKEGRLAQLDFSIELENPDGKKGLKGIEYPQGDFLSDLSFTSIFEPAGKYYKSKKVDITKEFQPEIIQYKLNGLENLYAKIPENSKYYKELYNVGYLPFAYDKNKSTVYSLYNKDGMRTSGDIDIQRKGENSYLLKFFDYKLDENNIFPENYQLEKQK